MPIQLTEEYLTTVPERFSETIIRENVEKGQLRRFYEDFKLIERRMPAAEHDAEAFKREILPLIKFVKSKLAYAAGRKQPRNNNNLISDSFKNHFVTQINAIDSREDFRTFLLHYQAIIGYYTYLESQQSRGGARYEGGNRPYNQHGGGGGGRPQNNNAPRSYGNQGGGHRPFNGKL